MNTTTAERDFSPLAQARIQAASIAFIVMFLIVGLYGILALRGAVPPMPWSPLANTQTDNNTPPSIDLNQFDIPDGYAPAVPTPPQDAPAQSTGMNA